jgi:uncharacterized membrane protein (GlpM family)
MKKTLFGLLACLSLLACLLSAWLSFVGRITDAAYKKDFLLASLCWFVFATVWASSRKKAG